MFENNTEDDGLQLILDFNYEWKIGPKAFLDYGIWGAHGVAEDLFRVAHCPLCK